MGLILAWMYSTSELDELFQFLNLIEKDLNLKGLEPHWSNTTLRDPILSVLHTFSPKSTRVRGPCPLLMGAHPPMGNPGSATAND